MKWISTLGNAQNALRALHRTLSRVYLELLPLSDSAVRPWEYIAATRNWLRKLKALHDLLTLPEILAASQATSDHHKDWTPDTKILVGEHPASLILSVHIIAEATLCVLEMHLKSPCFSPSLSETFSQKSNRKKGATMSTFSYNQCGFLSRVEIKLKNLQRILSMTTA